MQPSYPLAIEFVAAPPEGGGAEPSPALEASLVRIVANARAAWPGVELPIGAFLRHLASKIEGPSVTDDLSELHTDSLYLAAACALGSARALDAFEAQYFDTIDSVVRRSRPRGVEPDDVRQMIREKLFVADEQGARKMASYSGKGDLRGWFRVVVTRSVLNLATRAPKDAPALKDDESALLNLPAREGSELDYIRSHYAEDMREVFGGLRALTVMSGSAAPAPTSTTSPRPDGGAPWRSPSHGQAQLASAGRRSRRGCGRASSSASASTRRSSRASSA